MLCINDATQGYTTYLTAAVVCMGPRLAGDLLKLAAPVELARSAGRLPRCPSIFRPIARLSVGASLRARRRCEGWVAARVPAVPGKGPWVRVPDTPPPQPSTAPSPPPLIFTWTLLFEHLRAHPILQQPSEDSRNGGRGCCCPRCR